MRSDGPLLLVEDNPDDQVLLRRALDRARVRRSLVVAGDGLEASELLFGTATSAALDPAPALILLDVKLPRLDGHELLARIRADLRTRLIPVVMLTSSCEQPDVHRAYELGVNSYVRKPLDFARFIEVTKQLCQYWLDVNHVPASSDGRAPSPVRHLFDVSPQRSGGNQGPGGNQGGGGRNGGGPGGEG
jgi:two-component system response regulator